MGKGAEGKVKGIRGGDKKERSEKRITWNFWN